MKKIFTGIDVSKKTIDASVIIPSLTGGKPILVVYDKFENRPSGFRKMVSMVRKIAGDIAPGEWLFCCETTGCYDAALCDYMHEKGLDIWREHAALIAKARRIHGKDDRSDSMLIAEYAWRNHDQAVIYLPKSDDVKNLRQLFLYRRQLVEMRKQLVSRSKEIKESSDSNAALSYMYKDSQKHIKSLTGSINECEDRMRKLMSESSEMGRAYGHIISVCGIGLVSAAAILIYTNNFQSVTSYKRFASYCGIVPFYKDSGESVHIREYVGHKSNRMVRVYLMQAAQTASRFNQDLMLYRERMLQKGKPMAVVINNIANKLLRIVFSLVKNDCDFETSHEYLRTQRFVQQAVPSAVGL